MPRATGAYVPVVDLRLTTAQSLVGSLILAPLPSALPRTGPRDRIRRSSSGWFATGLVLASALLALVTATGE